MGLKKYKAKGANFSISSNHIVRTREMAASQQSRTAL
jgi:hypothetical protein